MRLHSTANTNWPICGQLFWKGGSADRQLDHYRLCLLDGADEKEALRSVTQLVARETREGVMDGAGEPRTLRVELLREDPFFEMMLRVEQECQRSRAIRLDRNRPDVPNLKLARGCADRAVVGL